MTLVKFNRKPFATGFNNLVDEFFNDMPALFRNDFPGNVNGHAPVNITETANGYSLELVAPGFDKNDFKVDLDQNILSISAEKKSEEKKEEGKSIRSEYRFQSFKRSFTLDEKINEEGIEAKYVNGVLTLNLPRREAVKQASKQISIQ